MINLFHITKIELFKTFRLRLFRWFLLVPVLTITFTGYILFAQISKGFLASENFWRMFFNYFLSIYGLLLPIMQSIVASTQVDLEYKSNAFQVLYTLPVKRHNILFSKLFTHSLWTFLFMLFSFALVLFAGMVFMHLYPEAVSFEFNLYFNMLQLFIKMLFACITIGIIHLFLSYCGISSQISVLLASFATIVSILSVGWKYSYINPYSWLIRFTRDFIDSENNNWLVKDTYFIILYVIIFVGITLIINKNKRRLTI